MSLTVAWILGGFLAAAGLGVAVWALYWDRARGRKRCPKCWYDLVGAAGDVKCPECAWVMKRERQLGRTRRRWKPGLAALVALGAGIGWPLFLTLRQPGTGWWTFTPAPILFWIIMEQDVPRGEASEHVKFHDLPEAFRPGWSRDWIVSHAIHRLETGTVAQRQLAADALGWMAPRELAIGPLCNALADPDPGVRKEALWALQQLRWDADDAIATTIRMARDPNETSIVRSLAFRLLAASGRSVEAQTTCMSSLSDASKLVRSAAAWALGEVAVDAGRATAALQAILENAGEDPDVRLDAASSLGKLGSIGAVSVLTRSLTSGELGGNLPEVIRALGRMGPSAADAIEPLTSLAVAPDTHVDVAVNARAAVLTIAGKQPNMAAAFVSLFDDDDPAVRCRAVMGIAYLHESKGQVSTIMTLLDDVDADVRQKAALTLSYGEAASASALPRLKELADSDPEEHVRETAGYAARRIERALQLAK